MPWRNPDTVRYTRNHMRLTVVTPLFPPDVHDVANYHKDLVTRLTREHTVTVALFGYLPEGVPQVLFTTIDKRTNVTTRLWQMFCTLLTLRKKTDWFIVTNGPSTELPALILSFFTRTPILLLASDSIQSGGVYRLIHKLLLQKVQATITILETRNVLIRPEIHPLIAGSASALSDYETAWANHLTDITHHLHYDTHH